MIQIPANIRPALTAVVKHHFWILLAMVPIVVLPIVFLARGKLAAEIDAARSQIDGRLSAMKSVAGKQPHPNESWSGQIGKATTRVKKETLDEWGKFWQSQEPLRTWPESLGPDFLQRIATLKPGGKLPRPLLERYQNGVRAIVRTIPKRMGADDMMAEGEVGGPAQPAFVPPPNVVRPGVGEKPPAVVQWDPADQARIYASFKWDRTPSTTQMLLAQEELWVYGVLADAIARVNKPSGGAYNAAVPVVLQLAVGYPAAEEDPGGAAGGRILVPAAAAQPNPMGEFGPASMPAMAEGGEGAAQGRPPHPRFAVAAGPQMAGPGGPVLSDAAASPDDLLRNWIYVDFKGKPLMAADLATSPDSLLLHLMPFVLRAIVDERKLDGFLVDLATAPMPIDVRQVRINPGTGGFAAAMPGAAAMPAGTRPHDIVVELRGTVALATPPDRQLLGLEAEAIDGDDADGDSDEPGVLGEQATPEPAAAVGDGDRS